MINFSLRSTSIEIWPPEVCPHIHTANLRPEILVPLRGPCASGSAVRIAARNTSLACQPRAASNLAVPIASTAVTARAKSATCSEQRARITCTSLIRDRLEIVFMISNHRMLVFALASRIIHFRDLIVTQDRFLLEIA